MVDVNYYKNVSETQFDSEILKAEMNDLINELEQERAESNRLEQLVSLPSIQIDKDAIRFKFQDEGINLFWEDLFIGQRTVNFQAELMKNIFKAYNEIIARSN